MTASSARAPKRILAAFVALLLGGGAFALLVPGTAQADTRPVAGTPTTVSADALPTVQINGVAWAQAVVGNTVYVGGAFSTARPAGAAAGTQETPRGNLLAYDIRTGELISSFAPNLNGQVLDVEASPDGSRIYVAGDFTEVDGQVRRRVAAFDTATGALVPGWHPNINSQVRAIAATDTTVYLGGSITAVGGVSRTRLAAVTASDGALLDWAPLPGVGSTAGNSDGNRSTSDQVMALTIAAGQVVAGGRFDSMNGTKATGVTALDPVTGATRPFAINQRLTNQGINSAVYSLTTDGQNVYGSAYDYYGPGNLEGSFVVRATDGAIVEVNDCRGDTYSTFPMRGALYVAGHPHDCGNIGGFPEENPRIHKFSAAFTTTPTGVVGSRTIANANFRGQPAGSMLAWTPTMAPGTVTGQGQAGWSVSGNDKYVVYAGEFPRVNGVGQQGLVRFAVVDIAPNAIGPDADGFTASVTSPAPGQAQIAWTTAADRDNQYLTYSVYREGTAAPVYETAAASMWWQRSQLSTVDAGVGGALRYRVVASDPFGNAVATDWVSVDVTPVPTAGTPVDYAATIKADGAQSHWRFGESAGQAVDAIGGRGMTVGTGVSRGVQGVVVGNTAYGFNGSAQATAATQNTTAAPDTFTAEAWFRTSSTAGGRIMGFASSPSGTSSTYDRQVYLDAQGRVNFGVSTRFLFWTIPVTVSSGTGYNDGQWHHVAASMSSAGMALYVDGALAGTSGTTSGLAYNGYFRVGSDRAMGGSNTFDGRIDEVALYPAALSAQRVAAHAAAPGGATVANQPPTARMVVTGDELTAAFDGRGSTDPDGTLASYAWTFGDGSTGTGATASHTYAAEGSYLVTLVVTDVRGATSTARRLVTVTIPVPNERPTAALTAAGEGLTVRVDGSGSSDRDGTLAGFSWDFGDGTTGTGRTAAHTYASGGRYTITLTVTDDDGATATTSTEVTVLAPAVAVEVVRDSFDRTVSGGLGSADVGGSWTVSAGSTRQSVVPGAGELRLDGAGQNTGSFLGSVSLTEADVRTSVQLTAMPTGNGTYVYVSGRRVDAGLEYRVRARVLPDGRVALALSRLAGGTESFPGGEVVVPGLTYAVGQTLNLRVQVTGTGSTELTARAWLQGAPEPSEPALTRTDDTAALQVPGAVGVNAHRPGGTTAATVVRVTALSVATVGETGDEPGQVAPVAVFSATPDGLAVTLDGTGSTDADGTIESYAWDLGDGSTADGATVTHSYDAAGTYPVTLTVTDDDDLTHVATQQVTVVVPTVTRDVVVDAFDRTVSGGLGTAGTGGAWTASAGDSRQSVTPGAAELALPGAGHNTGSYLGEVSLTEADLRTTFSLTSAPTGSGTYLYLTPRRVADRVEYRVRVRVMADGRVALALSRLSGGTEAFPGGETIVPGLSYAVGQALELRVQISGTETTEIQATVWTAGTEQPATPSMTWTDGTADLQAPGSVGLTAHRPGSSTAATSVLVHQLRVTAVVPADEVDTGGGTGGGETGGGETGGGGTGGEEPPVEEPANSAPTAALTAAVSGLTVVFDGASSADADGTVTGWTWDFGDGATGAGATAAHTYAAAGTFTVTLTVTDDDGSTATTTQDVTVEQPPAPVVEDTFDRTVEGGLGEADLGGAWTVSAGGTRQSVTPGTAELRLDGAGQNTGSYLGGLSLAGADVRTSFSLTSMPTGSGTYVYVTGRRTATGEEYRVRVRVMADGRVALALSRLSGGGESFPGGEVVVPDLTYVPGAVLQVRVQVAGSGTTEVRASVWADGGAEPVTAQLVRSDSTAALQGAGSVGLTVHRPGNTTEATAVRFGRFTVAPVA